MKLVSVDGALKELHVQNDTLFVRLRLILLYIQIQTLKVTVPVLNSLLEKRISFCSSFKALSTDSSFIKIGNYYHKLSILELNFHYRLSSHCLADNFTKKKSFNN